METYYTIYGDTDHLPANFETIDDAENEWNNTPETQRERMTITQGRRETTIKLQVEWVKK